jgi:hypothetical protein
MTDERGVPAPDLRALHATGVTMAQAAERLHAAAQHLDSEFEVLIATYRPKLWKRMNRRPTRMARLLQRLTR